MHQNRTKVPSMVADDVKYEEIQITSMTILNTYMTRLRGDRNIYTSRKTALKQ